MKPGVSHAREPAKQGGRRSLPWDVAAVSGTSWPSEGVVAVCGTSWLSVGHRGLGRGGGTRGTSRPWVKRPRRRRASYSSEGLDYERTDPQGLPAKYPAHLRHCLQALHRRRPFLPLVQTTHRPRPVAPSPSTSCRSSLFLNDRRSSRGAGGEAFSPSEGVVFVGGAGLRARRPAGPASEVSSPPSLPPSAPPPEASVLAAGADHAPPETRGPLALHLLPFSPLPQRPQVVERGRG